MTKRIIPAIAVALWVAACVRPSPPRVVSVPSLPASDANNANAAPSSIVQQGAVASISVNDPPAPAAQDTGRISTADVARRASEVFGDAPSSGPVAALTASAVAAPSWDIDVRSYESTERVEHYVQLFSGPARERIESRLERGTRYEPMIRAKLRAGGLPEDMYYLALVESGFDQNAYSRAAAVGMWQFMTSTARDVGLRVDWWVDERRDPIKSTDGAVRYLKDLNEQFGSLYLAAAAYNGGPVKIARGLTRYADEFEGTAGDDLFFALAGKDYLRNETREYVPQLIAAALIAKEPARYGMSFASHTPLTYDSVRVGPLTPLAAIAHASGAPLADVEDLNPQVLRGVTPPADSFVVRVPTGAADSFAVNFAALPSSERLAVSRTESKKGESVASIAKRSGISPRQLALYNPSIKRLKSGNLAPGQMVMIPTEAVALAAAAVPDPAIERYSTAPASATTHVVKPGESLASIAKKYNTSTAALMKANGLKHPLIVPGQSLVIGAKKKTAATTTATSKKPVSKKPMSKKKTKRSATA